MNIMFSKGIPVVFAISLMLFFSSLGISSIYGQGAENATQQQNQTSQQSQQPQQQKNQSISQDSKMHEQLLNYTNMALIELENDDSSAVEQNLLNIQQTLLNATNKQVVVVPESVMDSEQE